jgi:hypothetical protein
VSLCPAVTQITQLRRQRQPVNTGAPIIARLRGNFRAELSEFPGFVVAAVSGRG